MPLVWASHEPYLYRVVCFDQVFLFHRLTREVVRLTERWSNATLVFSAGRGILVNSEGERRWAHELLKKHLQEKNGVFYVLDDVDGIAGGRKIPLAGYFAMGRWKKAEFNIRLGDVATMSTLKLLAYDREEHGAFLWWNIPHIYEVLVGTVGKKWHKRRQKSWPAWHHMLQQLELPREALQQSLGRSSENNGPVSEVPYAVATTHALIALLARWCSPHPQNGRVQELAAAAEAMLRGLLSLLDAPFNLHVTTGEAHWVAPYAMKAPRGFHVMTCRDGVLNLIDIKRDVPTAFAAAMPTLVGIDLCSPMEALQSAPILSRRGDVGNVGWLPHFIWQLGSMLEARIAGKTWDELQNPRWREDSPTLRFDGLQRATHQRAGFIIGYDAANKKHFGEPPLISALALDDSRVGRSQWKLCVLLDCSRDFAVWLMPQARAVLLIY